MVALDDALNELAKLVEFACLYDPATGHFWHNGATGGYSAYAFSKSKTAQETS
jgi:hypothetical protein